MDKKVGRVLINKEQIKKRTKELAKQISKDYKDKNLVCITILRGAFMFLADLCREITVPAKFDFMAISSYGDKSESSGVVRIYKDLDMNIAEKDVLIIEDIVDTGRTMDYLLRNLKTRNPKSIEICTLLNKPANRIVNIKIKYVGFEISPEFVIGYGLDFAEDYRHIEDVRVFEED
ncbi:MAG: hypoxanthine phosphoribosyltransferase [Actinomycetia bacterium]|nr:hypoxanthine phosphoribosyltransferase [Actinomycetes bacterium]